MVFTKYTSVNVIFHINSLEFVLIFSNNFIFPPCALRNFLSYLYNLIISLFFKPIRLYTILLRLKLNYKLFAWPTYNE
jgi:hypothetical protein